MKGLQMKLTMLEDHNHGVCGLLKAGRTYDVPDFAGEQITRDFPHKVKGGKVKKAVTKPENKNIAVAPKDKAMSRKGSRWRK